MANHRIDRLESESKKTLAAMARDRGITGWHAMRKAELIEALVREGGRSLSAKSRSTRRNTQNGHANGKVSGKANAKRSSKSASASNGSRGTNGTNGAHVKGNGYSNGTQTTQDVFGGSQLVPARRRNLAMNDGERETIADGPASDYFQVAVRNPYWLSAKWALSQATVDRARHALGPEWHLARPVIRVFDASPDESNGQGKRIIRDVDISGDVNSWFVHVDDSSEAYRLHIGYLTPKGRFFALARSGTIVPPHPSNTGTFDQSSQSEKGTNGHSNGSKNNGRRSIRASFLDAGEFPRTSASDPDFKLDVDVELMVHGQTHPRAELLIHGQAVPLRDDGTFSLRFPFADGRQVIPAIAVTPDGAEQRTVVLAVERNTKELEPQVFDENDA